MRLPEAFANRVLWICCSVLAAVAAGQAQETETLPTYVSVEQRLESEIRKMIEAGHLAPGVSTFEQHFRYDVRNDLGWNLDEYWHNPAELVYTLTLAMPHLSPALRAETRAYLEEEFERFRPSQFVQNG